MAVTADPLWINASAGAPAYSANELRQAMALALQYTGRTLGARSGVRPGGNALQTSIAGSTITVRAGVACVDPGLTTAQGPYWACLPADDTFTLTAAHATLPRKDITVLRVYDHDEDSSGQRKVQAEYLVGTAAGSPSEPGVPSGAFKLATIDVPSVANGNPPSVTINNPFAVAAGAVLPVRDVTDRGTLTGFDGFVIYRMDRDWVEIHDGTAWRVQGVAVCTSTSDRDTAITNPYNGQMAVTTDTGSTWLRYAGAWIRLAIGGLLFAQKSADESVTSSTTLQNDDHLFLSVEANALYELDAYLLYTGAADPAGGLKLGWTGPASAGMQWTPFGVPQGNLVSYDVIPVDITGGGRIYGSNGGFVMSMQPKGYLLTGGTAGTLQLKWAQGASNATATVLKTGSFIQLTRKG